MPVTKCIWDEVNDTVLMETDGEGNATAVYTQEPGPFGGLIGQRRGAESRFFHVDALGSVRAVTDATGQITDTYLHDAFGNTIQSSGASFVPYHFVGPSGYYHDEEVSGYYVRARHYDPALGRWRSQDPLGYRGGMNPYRYVRNSPPAHTDPSGKECEKPSARRLTLGEIYDLGTQNGVGALQAFLDQVTGVSMTGCDGDFSLALRAETLKNLRNLRQLESTAKTGRCTYGTVIFGLMFQSKCCKENIIQHVHMVFTTTAPDGTTRNQVSDFAEAWFVDNEGRALRNDLHIRADWLRDDAVVKKCYGLSFETCCGTYNGQLVSQQELYRRFATTFQAGAFRCCGPKLTYGYTFCLDNTPSATLDVKGV